MANQENDGLIEKLANQPLDVMEKVLSNASQKNVPIQLDGIIYHIPKAISDLIDNLYIQTRKNEKKVD